MNYDDMTIAQAKAILRNKLHEGFECPLCKGHTQLYSRPLTSSMVAGLILMYAKTKHEQNKGFIGQVWIHLERFFSDNKNATPSMRGDIPKLRFWGFIIPKEGNSEDGNPNNGYYTLTKAAFDFIEGRTKVPSHVDIYNNKFYGYSVKAKEVTVYQALKQKFNYNEIIKNEETNNQVVA